jgi:uncharacterized protein (TIGR02646 family)
MKWIDKKLNNQPASLKKHLKTPHHNYGNYKEKDELRTALLKEQGFICCYCMRRIQKPTEDKMKIEHFKAFSIYDGKTEGKPDLTLDFTNLLGVCKGNKGAAEHLQHCDELKGNQQLEINPMDRNMMQKIRFNSEGIISIKEENGLDKALNSELNKTVLNLNVQTLKEERKKIWTKLDQLLQKEFDSKMPSKSFINQKIKEAINQLNGKFEPMCQVSIYYWERKLRQIS